jgi:hypothetical protein
MSAMDCYRKPRIAQKLIDGALAWTNSFLDESVGDLHSEAVPLKCSDNRSDSHDANCDIVTSHIGPQGNAVFMPTISEIGIYKAKLCSLPSYMLKLICEQTEEQFKQCAGVGSCGRTSSSH